MRSKRFLFAVVFLLILSFVLAACATATDTPEPTTPPEVVEPTKEPVVEPTKEPVVEPTEVPVVEPTEAEGGPKRGGVLKHALPAINTFDPAFLATVQDDQVARYWHDQLVWVDGNLQVDWDRSLATGATPNADGTVWTFDLRQNVTFHDGRPMTAEDIVFTFERLSDPEIGAATVGLYENILAIEAVDDHTVQFTLAKPNPDFLTYDLNDYHAHIMDMNTEDYETEWNGTGPFIIETYIPEDRVVMTRNPNYWRMGEDDENLPYLDGLEFIFLSEASAQFEALRGGQVDWINYMSPEFIQPAMDDNSLEVFGKITNFHYVIHMRSDQPPADNVLVRQAIKYATDREGLLQLAGLGFGVAGNDSPIGPAFGDFFLDEMPPRDVEKAKDLLTQAGYEDGLEIELTVQDAQIARSIATVWAEQLAEAGITVNIQVVPIGVYYGDGLWLESPFAITDWGPRSSPQPYLGLAYVCGAIWNESHFCDEELDELATQAASEMDPVKRTELFHEISRIFIERGPVIVPYFGQVSLGYRANVMPGIEWESISTNVDLADVWLDE
jgi:peptide/nickel transport system substrate-binding protein